MYGRGGEEAAYLRAAGHAVTIVPGITSASGIAAELGLPLTHRGVATSLRILTGHLQDGGLGPLDVLAPDSTLVVYMGLASLPALVARLPAAGMPADTPVVAVERGTTPQQREVWGRLPTIVAAVAAAGLASPTLLIVGPAVALSPYWPPEGGSAAKSPVAPPRYTARMDMATAAALADGLPYVGKVGGRGEGGTTADSSDRTRWCDNS